MIIGEPRLRDLLRIHERGPLGRCLLPRRRRHFPTLITAEPIIIRCATSGDEIGHQLCHLLVYWSGASTLTFLQVSSGLNEVKCSAMLAVCGPRSFSNTVPS
jgi:hypothetical protein